MTEDRLTIIERRLDKIEAWIKDLVRQNIQPPVGDGYDDIRQLAAMRFPNVDMEGDLTVHKPDPYAP